MRILVLLYAMLPAVQVVVFITNQWFYSPSAALNFSASIVALHWMPANTTLTAKVPALQRLLPYDRKITFHIFASFGLVIAVAGHAIYKTIIGSYFNVVTWMLPVVLFLFFASALLWIPVPGFRKIRTRILHVTRES